MSYCVDFLSTLAKLKKNNLLIFLGFSYSPVLMDNNTLGIQAKNIRILTAQGVVTLRGVVKDDRERTLIGNNAKNVPNVKRVDNQIEVITPTPN